MKELEYDIYLHYPINTEEEKQEESTTDDWALEFKRYLEITMERIMHKTPKILDSHALEKDVNSIEQDRKQVFDNTGLFIIFTSEEAYQNTTYNEIINEIYSSLETKQDEDVQRVFKVDLEPANDELEHDNLKEALNYEFFEKAGLSKRPKTMQITEQVEPSDVFWSRLLDLSYDLINALSSFKDKPLLTYTKSLFLANVSPDQQEHYESLKREFLQQGIKIYPDKKLPYDSPEIKKAVMDYLEKCDMSIHIIGERYGDYVSKSEYSITELQNRIVDDYCSSHKDFEKIIFISPKSRIRDGKQKLFLERLRKDATDQTEIIQTNITEFREIIIQKLNRKDQPEKPVKSKKQLYYITEPNEKDTLEQVEKLCKSKGVSVIQPQFSDSIVDNLNTHLNNLIESDMLVINYTNNNPIWLQTKLQDSFKVYGMGKNNPYKWKCILFHSQEKDKLVKEHVESFETFDFKNKNAINAFEKRLKEIIDK